MNGGIVVDELHKLLYCVRDVGVSRYGHIEQASN